MINQNWPEFQKKKNQIEKKNHKNLMIFQTSMFGMDSTEELNR